MRTGLRTSLLLLACAPLVGAPFRATADEAADVTALGAALSDPAPAAREAAARALLALGPAAKPQAAALAKAMGDRVPVVRLVAAAALIRSGAPSDAAPAVLVAGTKDADEKVRLEAVRLLVASGAGAGVVLAPLLDATKDRAPAVAVAAIEGATSVGAKSPDVLRALARCANADDAQVRAAAFAAVPKLTDEPVVEAVHFGGAFRGDRVKRARLARFGDDLKLGASVDAALDWLARHQSADGRWSAAGFDDQCKLNRCDGPGWKGQFDTGVTGLALLAFLGAGETQTTGPHKDVVARGLAFLRASQGEDGRIGPGPGAMATYDHGYLDLSIDLGRPRTPKTLFEARGDGLIYDHAIAAVALTEDYMLTLDAAVGDAATRAVVWALNAETSPVGWRSSDAPTYSFDTSVLGWMSWAVGLAHAAHLGGVDASHLQGALAWVESATEKEFGRTGYQQRGGPPVRLAAEMSTSPPDQSESLTAEGAMVRLFAGRPRKEEFVGMGADVVLKKLPRWNHDKGQIDFYFWFWGATAVRQLDERKAKAWTDALKTELLGHQRMESGRGERGSWDPLDCWSSVGGRVYSTSMCCMALEAAWRMDPFDAK